MSNKIYLDKSQPYPIIRFPDRVVPKTFDEVLRETYKETLFKKTPQVEFDFSKVKWCDIFELSLVSLWILELRSAGKQVTFRFPLEKRFFQFLITYRFETFLLANNVNIETSISFKATPAPTDLIRAPFYPLTFTGEEGLKNLLEDLAYGNRLEIVLSDLKDSEIVKSGVIRDVILKELIDNMILHGGARFSHLVMTKLGGGTDVSSDRLRPILHNLSDIEKPFFRRLSGNPYLALVIGDKGPGITETLRVAYLADEIVGVNDGPPSDDQVLEYAFLYHSTRRSLNERLGEIVNVISQEGFTYPPATGLFRLKEKVRAFSGFLCVRSGSSLIAYDFLNYPNLERPAVASKLKNHKKLTDFGGTQYKIYFPIFHDRLIPLQRQLDYPWNRVSSEVHYSYLFINNYGPSATYQTAEQEASRLIQIFSEVDRISFANKGRVSALIIDFQGERSLSAKAVHYLLFGCMQRQNSNFSIIAININTDSEEWQSLFDQLKPPQEEKTPLLLFDERFEQHFFGATSEEIALIESLLEGKVISTSESLEKYDHLLCYDELRERYESRHSLSNIMHASRNETKAELGRIVLNPLAGIFHPDTKVLLPSNKYCKGFFEIYRLLTNQSSRAFLRSWLRLWLAQLKPDFVISISRHVSNIVDEVLKELSEADQKRIQNFRLRTPTNEIELVRLPLKLDREKTGVIISEVLGSGETLSRVLDKTQHTNITKIIVMINADQKSESIVTFKGRDYQVEALMEYQLSYHDTLPQGWLYSDVRQVDPEEHLLIPPTQSLDGPLWKGIDVSKEFDDNEINEIHNNHFLTDCVIPTSSYLEAHFTNQEMHLTYLFNIPTLIAYFSEDVAELITERTKASLSIITPAREITHIIFYSKNPGMEKLANLISARFERSVPISVSSEEPWARFNPETQVDDMDSVIVLDDAIVSGDTIFKIYDIAEQRGAQHIFAYVLVKRGTDDLARRFEKTSQYGHSKIQARYLADVELPTYTIENCPVCDRVFDLEYLRDEFPEQSVFSGFLTEEIDKLAEIPVAIIEVDEMVGPERGVIGTTGNALTFRWKLELAKRKMGPRKELDRVVRRFIVEPKRVLNLFQVIYREQRVFLKDETVRQNVFYDTFATNIVAACRYFLSNIEPLEEEEFEAVICLLIFLDEDFRVDEMLDLFRRTLSLPRKFLRLLTEVMLAPAVDENSGRMLRMFKRLLGEVVNDRTFEPLINDIVRYWDERQEKFAIMRSDRLSLYRSLAGGALHETGHLKDTVLGFLESDPGHLDGLVKSWTEFQDYVASALPMLRKFSGNHLSGWLSDKLNSNLLAVEILMKSAKGSASLLKTANVLTATEFKELRLRLKHILLNVFTLISGPEGTNALLRTLETNIKTVAFRAFQYQTENLRRLGIRVEKAFPEDSCTVFGEDTFIIQAFQNLIDNVWKNSEANFLRIETLFDEEKETVDVRFLDNGRGISKPLFFGDGLKVVKRNALICCGDFEIDNLPTSDVEYGQGFRTVATITLPVLRRGG
jgi:hypoxanthine-guanine phosphoribosyltransferase/signal transduction histidine kinase